MFEFTDDLKTGIHHIDNQHRELVKLVNVAISLGVSNPSRYEMFECLDFLGEYVIKHFGDEEKLQIDCNYPYYVKHKAIHEKFIETFKGLYTEFKDNGATGRVSYGLSNSVTNWLIMHIKGDDMRFSKHFISVMLYDLYESKDGIKRIVFPSFRLGSLPSFLASHYGIDVFHARETAEKLAEGEECPPFGYVSRTLSLKYNRQS